MKKHQEIVVNNGLVEDVRKLLLVGMQSRSRDVFFEGPGLVSVSGILGG